MVAFKKRCPVCRSREWRKDPSSGIVACVEGHVLQGYRKETNDAVEHSQHAMRKRSMKSQRVRKEKESMANPIFYHGDRARYHYFQCLQVILRMQIKILTQLWRLPPEFEILCRDVWALHLSNLKSPPPEKHLLQAQEVQIVIPSSVSKERSKEKDGSNGDDDDDDPISSSSSSSSSDSDEEDSQLADLLRENSEPESSGDDDADGADGNVAASDRKGVWSRRAKRRWQRDDSVAGNIAVLFCACWTLRVPVIYQDFISLICASRLPYLDPVRLLPEDLAKHLNKHTKHALSPHHPPTPILLHNIVTRLAKCLFTQYDILTPELNAAPVLWRAVRHLGGNPTLYTLAKALARYLEMPLTLNSVMAPTLASVREGKTDPLMHRSDNVPPEMALVATVLIALKSVYGLNEKDVCPNGGWDPACTMPTLDNYLTMLKGMKSSKFAEGEISSEMPAELHETDVSNIDAYLEFCERALVPSATSSPNRSPGNQSTSDNQFPSDFNPQEVEMISASATAERLVVLPAVQLAVEGETSKKVGLPGEQYAIYSAQDILGTLPDKFAIVVERAARWVGVNSEEILSVVERFERRLVRLWSRSKQRDKAAASIDKDSSNRR